MYIGVDAGSLNTKAVLMDEDKVMSMSMIPTSDVNAAEKAIEDVLRASGHSSDEVGAIVSTGSVKNEIPGCTGDAAEVVCAAKGARYFSGSMGAVIDIGAETICAIRFDSEGNVGDFTMNDKCASGTGIFLDSMAKVLRVPVDEMGKLSEESTQDIDISAQCVVFAESEVVSLIHKLTPKEDIVSGIHKSIATRLNGMLSRVGANGTVVAVGGLAKNKGVVGWLEKLAGVSITVPEHPEFVGAVGAAILAAEKEQKGAE